MCFSLSIGKFNFFCFLVSIHYFLGRLDALFPIASVLLFSRLLRVTWFALNFDALWLTFYKYGNFRLKEEKKKGESY